jgi:hypothetical protein
MPKTKKKPLSKAAAMEAKILGQQPVPFEIQYGQYVLFDCCVGRVSLSSCVSSVLNNALQGKFMIPQDVILHANKFLRNQQKVIKMENSKPPRKRRRKEGKTTKSTSTALLSTSASSAKSVLGPSQSKQIETVVSGEGANLVNESSVSATPTPLCPEGADTEDCDSESTLPVKKVSLSCKTFEEKKKQLCLL